MLTQAREQSRVLRLAVEAYKPLRANVEAFLRQGTELPVPTEKNFVQILRNITDPDRPKAQRPKFWERGLRVTTLDGTPCSVMARTDAYGDPDADDFHRARIILSIVTDPGYPASEVQRALPPVHAIGQPDNFWGSSQIEQLVRDLQEIPALLALANE